MTSTSEVPVTLASLTRPDLIFPHLAGTDRALILREMCSLLAAGGVVTDDDRIYRLLEEREALGSTGIGAGVAVPHCKVKGLDSVILAVGVADSAIDFDSADGEPVRVFFVVLSPHHEPAAHLQTLAAISRWIKENGHLERLLAGRGVAEIQAALGVDAHGG